MTPEIFRTEFNIKAPRQLLNHQHKILSIGSCFSEHIGKKLQDNKFDIDINPFGILFNPISILTNVSNALLQQPIDENLIIFNEGVWKYHQFHSAIKSQDKKELITQYNNINSKLREELQKTNTVIITMGTAFVYTLIKGQKTVANCHKVPMTSFTKELLTVDQITNQFKQTLALLPKNIQIILTISPVRHIKDGMVENSLSKSILKMVCHQLETDHSNVDYFPSFEIFMDDLRDYRFYKEDMIHPNIVGINYVWNKFSNSYFTESTKAICKRWQKLVKAIHHKPFNPQTKEHTLFKNKTIQKLISFQKETNITTNKEVNTLMNT